MEAFTTASHRERQLFDLGNQVSQTPPRYVKRLDVRSWHIADINRWQ